ncbi:thiamine pyrophosphokinase [Hortaea werneckii]|nr:thiamine pyrophosphokinase [Hortaea werneckii]
MATESTHVQLHPAKYLQAKAEGSNGESGVALVILNSPITDHEGFRQLYRHASFRLCADGGANRLYDAFGTESNILPDLIHGDLDSLDATVRETYEKLGVQVSEDPDQYSTDFGKAITNVIEHLPEVGDILIHGSLGGRVDQGIGLLHELYREQKFRHPKVRFWLFTEASVSILLQSGKSLLQTPLGKGLIKRNIGILPLYGAANISTQGLEWDVDNWPTEMGGQVSTSNHIVADSVTIETDHDVLFTVEKAL